MEERIEKRDPVEQRAPVFKSWNRLYFFVLLSQAILILLFYLLSRSFK